MTNVIKPTSLTSLPAKQPNIIFALQQRRYFLSVLRRWSLPTAKRLDTQQAIRHMQYAIVKLSFMRSSNLSLFSRKDIFIEIQRD